VTVLDDSTFASRCYDVGDNVLINVVVMIGDKCSVAAWQ